MQNFDGRKPCSNKNSKVIKHRFTSKICVWAIFMIKIFIRNCSQSVYCIFHFALKWTKLFFGKNQKKKNQNWFPKLNFKKVYARRWFDGECWSEEAFDALQQCRAVTESIRKRFFRWNPSKSLQSTKIHRESNRTTKSFILHQRDELAVEFSTKPQKSATKNTTVAIRSKEIILGKTWCTKQYSTNSKEWTKWPVQI